MITFNKDGEVIVLDDREHNPYFRHKDGEAMTMVREYIRTHDDNNSPVFGDKEILDICAAVSYETGVVDPMLIAQYAIYYGLALAEKSQKVK